MRVLTDISDNRDGIVHGGTLPNKKRKREFAALKDEELIELEEIVRDAFDGFDLALGANLHSESEK